MNILYSPLTLALAAGDTRNVAGRQNLANSVPLEAPNGVYTSFERSGRI